MQAAETDWTLPAAHYVVTIGAALGGGMLGVGAALWRFATRQRGIDARFDAVETRADADEKRIEKVEGEVETIRDRVGTLATRDDMREQFTLVLTQLGHIQTRVDRLHDRRADD